jgi:hypothetical protein
MPVPPPGLQAGMPGIIPGAPLGHILPSGPPGHPLRYSAPPNIVPTNALVQMGQQLSMSTGIPPGGFYSQSAYVTPPGPGRGM